MLIPIPLKSLLHEVSKARDNAIAKRNKYLFTLFDKYGAKKGDIKSKHGWAKKVVYWEEDQTIKEFEVDFFTQQTGNITEATMFTHYNIKLVMIDKYYQKILKFSNIPYFRGSPNPQDVYLTEEEATLYLLEH